MKIHAFEGVIAQALVFLSIMVYLAPILVRAGYNGYGPPSWKTPKHRGTTKKHRAGIPVPASMVARFKGLTSTIQHHAA